jgi:hypothetical protein
MKAIATILLAGLMSGCAVFDAIDAKLREIGVMPGTSLEACGINPLAVVAVEGDGEAGVGIVVDEQTVFTAYHVVRRAGTVRVKFFGRYRGVYHKEVEGRVIYRNVSRDQCLIHVSTETPHVARVGRPSPGQATCITLGDRCTNRFGQEVPYPVVRECRIDGQRYYADRPTRKGDSGGPIVQNGCVVGLVHGPSLMVPCTGKVRGAVLVKKTETGGRQTRVASRPGKENTRG